MIRMTILLAALPAMVPPAEASGLAGEKIQMIEEPFGVDHGEQAVRFVETFEKPGVSLETLGAEVDGRPAFFQRRALTTHPDGSVKTAEWILWLHLASPDKQGHSPPGSQDRFLVRLFWGGPPTPSAPFPGQAIRISQEGEFLMVDTGPAHFRVPNNVVSRAARGPRGPLAGFRSAGDSRWYGSEGFIEGAEIASVQTRVLAPGPAQALVAVTFLTPEELAWTSELTFTSGSPIVRIHDAMELQGQWIIDLSEDMAPDTQFACPWFDWESPNLRGTASEKPLRAWKAEDVRGGEWPDLNEFFRLDPKWHDYQYMKGPWAWYYNKADRLNRPTAFAMFAWNMTQWHPTFPSRPRAVVRGEARGALRIIVPLTGGPHTRTLEAEDPDDPVARVVRTSTAERSWGIGAFPVPDIRPASDFWEEAEADAREEILRAARRQVEDEKREIRQKAEDALRAAAGDPEFRPTGAAIEAEMRRLGWPAQRDEEIARQRAARQPAPTEEAIRRHAERRAAATAAPARDAALRALVRHAHLPVSKIKDWIFTWPEVDKNMDQGIFRGLEELAALQKEIREGRTPLAQMVQEHIARVRATVKVSTDDKGRSVERAAPEFGNDWEVAQAILEGDVRAGPVFVYSPPRVFRPDARWIYHASYTDGQLNPTTAPRGIRSFIWDQSMNFLWQRDGRAAANRNMAAMAYIFSDPDFWNGRYYDWGIGNPNFHTDMHNIPGMVAAQLRTHPHALRWAAYSRREIFADVARSSWQPGGGWTESPGYTAHAFSVFLPTAHAFRRAGFTDAFADPHFRSALEFMLNLLTPYDKRRGARGQMALGDSTAEPRVENFLQAAMAYATTDPAFASRLMAGARAATPGGTLIAPGSLGNTLSTTNPGIPADPAWKLQSRYYGGVGAFLRSRFGTPREGLVSFKAGPARNHYQGDELSFTWWAEGDYLAVDYGSFYSPRMNPDWTHNKVSFGMAASSPVARMMAFETAPEGDLAVAENVNETLQLMTPPYASARALWDYQPMPIAPITNRRLLLWVKHPDDSPLSDYLVVRDELEGTLEDELRPSVLRPRLEVVVREMIEAYVRDASWAPSQAAELFEELEDYLQRFGAPEAEAQALVAAAKAAVRPGRTSPFQLTESPALEDSLSAALPAFRFDHAPRSNLHLLALDQPQRSRERLEFRGQMDTDILIFCATGQDLRGADVRWFGWGHDQRPPDFVSLPADDRGRPQLLPWMGGPHHSFRHGWVLGRDVPLAASSSPKPRHNPLSEMAQWVSIPFNGQKAMTLVLYPLRKNVAPPEFAALEGGRVIKVSAGGQTETVTLATGLPVKLQRQGKEIVLSEKLPPVGGPQPEALVPRRTIETAVDKPDDNPQSGTP